MDRMSYDDVREVIATYSHKTLPLFADGWSRFPDERTAQIIIADLSAQLEFWNGRVEETADLINRAIEEIKKRV